MLYPPPFFSIQNCTIAFPFFPNPAYFSLIVYAIRLLGSAFDLFWSSWLSVCGSFDESGPLGLIWFAYCINGHILLQNSRRFSHFKLWWITLLYSSQSPWLFIRKFLVWNLNFCVHHLFHPSEITIFISFLLFAFSVFCFIYLKIDRPLSLVRKNDLITQILLRTEDLCQSADFSILNSTS